MEKLYRLSDLTSTKGKPGILPVSPASWWRWIAAGEAPKPIRLGENAVAWREVDIKNWLDVKASAAHVPSSQPALAAIKRSKRG